MALDDVDKADRRAVARIVPGMDGKKQPVLHVLMADGRVTEFTSAVIVVPESPRDEADTQVFGLLVNGRGEPYVDPAGRPIMLPALPLMVRQEHPPDAMLTYKEVAKRAGVSTSTVKRAVRDGELAEPAKVGERAVRFELSDVQAWQASKSKP
jgi:excisionase family DNA binding protein